jgi:hypothetical protein
MTQTNLIEKRKQLEQRKNRLKQIEASLNVQERKKRTRHLIALGGLVSKAKLDHWNSNSLFGALLFVKEKENDEGQMKTWTQQGGRAFSIEKAAIPKTPIIVKFAEIPSDDTKRTLKSQGLKLNPLRQEWEGHVVLEELKNLLAGCKVEIQHLEK